MKKILFVCLGNICRSPAAEGIFKKMIQTHQLTDQVMCDSAGLIDTHEGERADERMRHHAHKRGYDLTSLSRPIRYPEDFNEFDHILCMDDSNMRGLRQKDHLQKYHLKIQKITDFCQIHNTHHVPDPYYGGDEGFELVLDILEDACSEIIKKM